MTQTYCAYCGGWDVEWMHRCYTHKGVEYCRGCECPFCKEEAKYDGDDYYECDENETVPIGAR